MYLKQGTTVTSLHSELAYAGAINYCRFDSVGAAIWIGAYRADMAKKFSDIQIQSIMVCAHSLKVASCTKFGPKLCCTALLIQWDLANTSQARSVA